MKIKTAYRPKHESAADIPAEPNIPDVKIDGERPDQVVGISAEIPEPDQPPDATVALRRQIEALRHSEELQRQAAQIPQRQFSRQEKLAAWRAQGMSAEDELALTARPEMIDHPRLTAVAAHEAAQQHERAQMLTGKPRGKSLTITSRTCRRKQQTILLQRKRHRIFSHLHHRHRHRHQRQAFISHQFRARCRTAAIASRCQAE
jgi:hypothetical protein